MGSSPFKYTSARSALQLWWLQHCLESSKSVCASVSNLNPGDIPPVLAPPLPCTCSSGAGMKCLMPSPGTPPPRVTFSHTRHTQISNSVYQFTLPSLSKQRKHMSHFLRQMVQSKGYLSSFSSDSQKSTVWTSGGDGIESSNLSLCTEVDFHIFTPRQKSPGSGC